MAAAPSLGSIYGCCGWDSAGAGLVNRRAPALSEARIAAVDRDRRAGDEVRRGARQEHGDAGEVLRLAPAARRRARQHALMQAGHLRARIAREVGVDPAWQHSIHLDVVLGPGGSERLGELHDAALAGA